MILVAQLPEDPFFRIHRKGRDLIPKLLESLLLKSLTKRDVVRKTASFVKLSSCGSGLPHLKDDEIWSITSLERKNNDEVMIPLMKGDSLTFCRLYTIKSGQSRQVFFLQIFETRLCPIVHKRW